MQGEDWIRKDGGLPTTSLVRRTSKETGKRINSLPAWCKPVRTLTKLQNQSVPTTTALILVPTRELADQVFRSVEQLSSFCAKDVRTIKLTDKVSDTVQRSLLSTAPDVVISTPARAWNHANGSDSALSLKNLAHLVLDEADLLLSYGYDSDLESLSWALPKGIQTIMMSATLTDEVDKLKELFYRDQNPKLLDLEEPDAEGEGVTQLVTKFVTPT